jgi:hypothetical protein
MSGGTKLIVRVRTRGSSETKAAFFCSDFDVEAALQTGFSGPVLA